uniref:Uncharacterized protein n=1 Tax=Leersia perrieri TaxID=77586 RepID=A0A0D9WDT8_9ORYZ
MQDLFTGSSVDGSLAMDQNTCMDVSDGSDSDDSRDLLDLNCYTQHEEPTGEDSNTLPSPTAKINIDNSSSTSRASKKRPRGNKSPTKKPSNSKSRFAECTDEISAKMKLIQETFVATVPPQMPQFTDPHAILWQKKEATPLTPDQRVLVEVKAMAQVMDKEAMEETMTNQVEQLLSFIWD